jgi:hypothetical protein
MSVAVLIGVYVVLSRRTCCDRRLRVTQAAGWREDARGHRRSRSTDAKGRPATDKGHTHTVTPTPVLGADENWTCAKNNFNVPQQKILIFLLYVRFEISPHVRFQQTQIPRPTS